MTDRTFIIAEIGINHNGSIDLAYKLIEAAAKAGADAVKFQKRFPRISTPQNQWNIIRDTPWGPISYIDYRLQIEFNVNQYRLLASRAWSRGLDFVVSVWDWVSLNDMLQIGKDVNLKIPSAKLTDHDLVEETAKASAGPIILSTGMSTMDEIDEAVSIVKRHQLEFTLMHCTSTYPCPHNELNLLMIPALTIRYPQLRIGYSGHEVGLATTLAAVALGAKVVERHITLDRSMWGSDQAASVEPQGFAKMVKDIRLIEEAMGDGTKKVYDSELSAMKKLRGDPR